MAYVFLRFVTLYAPLMGSCSSTSYDHGLSPQREIQVAVCHARACRNAGSEAVLFEIEELARGLGRCTVRESRCLGACNQAPNALVVSAGRRSLHQRLTNVKASAALLQQAFGKAPSLDDAILVKRLTDIRQMRDRLSSQRIHNFALWRLNGVTPVSKHSAIFHLACGDKKRGTPRPRGRGKYAEQQTWHTTLLAPVGKSSEEPKTSCFAKDPLPWIERDYTPISSAKDWDSGKCDILIKIYADGLATGWLAKQPVGCHIWLSHPVKTLGIPSLVPDGNSFRPASVLLLLAGTGIVATPQILQHRDPVKNLGFSTPTSHQLHVPIDLIFSCRKDDVLMVADMVRWCSDSTMGLRHCTLLLTEPNSTAAGAFPDAKEVDAVFGDLQSLPNCLVLQARLSQELLAESMSRMPPEDCRIVVSGPAAFNAAAEDMLHRCGVSIDAITVLSA